MLRPRHSRGKLMLREQELLEMAAAYREMADKARDMKLKV
jgi:hypothetical protein